MAAYDSNAFQTLQSEPSNALDIRNNHRRLNTILVDNSSMTKLTGRRKVIRATLRLETSKSHAELPKATKACSEFLIEGFLTPGVKSKKTHDMDAKDRPINLIAAATN